MTDRFNSQDRTCGSVLYALQSFRPTRHGRGWNGGVERGQFAFVMHGQCQEIDIRDVGMAEQVIPVDPLVTILHPADG